MEEELQKRFTDCVYFLASPLTCKNGVNCEYRHSDIARLNPRDCWYWLAGGCLNPTCAFRHPPLEGRSETSSQSAPNQSTVVSVNKTGVPCYFFYNGFCNKGDKCSFLHGPDDSLPTWKSSTTASVNPDGPQVEKKTPVGSDTGSTPVDRHTNLVDTGSQRAAVITSEPELDIHESPPNNVVKQNTSPQVSGSPYDDAAGGRLDSPLAAAGSIQRRSHASTDESSEDAVEDHVDREEWLESSPGFDVLVDDRSEELGYEDDPEYLLHHDREGRELNGHYLGYDYEENAEYDPAYPVDGYDHLAGEPTENVRGARAHSRESVLNRIFPLKRNFLPSDLSFGGQHGRDLRDLLERRRTQDGFSRNHSSRRLESSRRISRSRERSRSRSGHRLHGRRASKFGNSFAGSRIDNEASLSFTNHEGRLRHSPVDRHRRNYRERSQERPQPIMSEVSVKSSSRKRSYTEDFTMFTGPKSLDQIKEEKKRAKENGDFSDRVGSLGRNAQENFDGPKSLGEILKEKGRLVSVVDGNNQATSS